ncbi:MAG: alpha/beta hydrolase [Chloroflexota bacterium]
MMMTTEDYEGTTTIVCLHGNGGGAFRFERIFPYQPANTCFQAITLPGFAHYPADPQLQTLTDYANHLHTLLQEYPRPLILLGHGIGGSIALEFGQHYSSEIDGLILHAPVGTRLERRLFPRLMASPAVRTFGKWLFSSKLARPLFRRLLFSQPVPPDYINRFFDEYRHCTVFEQMFDLITPHWFETLQPINLPTALLWGERERVLTVDQMADYKRLFTNPITRIIPAWDHFPMIEQPESYAKEISRLATELHPPPKFG